MRWVVTYQMGRVAKNTQPPRQAIARMWLNAPAISIARPIHPGQRSSVRRDAARQLRRSWTGVGESVVMRVLVVFVYRAGLLGFRRDARHRRMKTDDTSRRAETAAFYLDHETLAARTRDDHCGFDQAGLTV
ncbi:hypothetical protein BGV66_20560 [Burkholderia ubonensis]|uniref:Uncharacterized protein n=2 Tax=Burkholderia ubonensis TaxID=101571 RepID=A0ABD6Q0A0_9BURK|nr:hypothetical protein BGV66_20560 [Burkholderia ubonensis]